MTICPLYKKALIEGLLSHFGDTSISAIDDYIKKEKPEIIACDESKCAAYRSYFHEGEMATVYYCGLAGIERL